MIDGDYATSKHIKLHRYLSVGLVVGVVLIDFNNDNPAFAIRRLAGFVFPLVLIWFSDQLACWAIRTSGHWLNPSNADVAVRIVGWTILITLLGLRLLRLIFE